MLSTWPQELGFLDTRLKCKAAGNSGLLAQRSQARKISRGLTPGRRWSHTRTERTSATRGSSLWETLKAPKSQSVLYHSFPNGHETPCIHLKMVIFAEFSPRLHCHVAQYVNSSILWFSLHRQALLVRRTLLVCYNKREKEAAIQSHKIFTPMTPTPCPECCPSVTRHPTGSGAERPWCPLCHSVDECRMAFPLPQIFPHPSFTVCHAHTTIHTTNTPGVLLVMGDSRGGKPCSCRSNWDQGPNPWWPLTPHVWCVIEDEVQKLFEFMLSLHTACHLIAQKSLLEKHMGSFTMKNDTAQSLF